MLMQGPSRARRMRGIAHNHRCNCVAAAAAVSLMQRATEHGNAATDCFRRHGRITLDCAGPFTDSLSRSQTHSSPTNEPAPISQVSFLQIASEQFELRTPLERFKRCKSSVAGGLLDSEQRIDMLCVHSCYLLQGVALQLNSQVIVAQIYQCASTPVLMVASQASSRSSAGATSER